jgi:hypothetical protein
MQPFIEQTESQGQTSYYPYQFVLALVLVVFVGLVTFFVLRKQLTRTKPEKPSEPPEKPVQQATGFRKKTHPTILAKLRSGVQDRPFYISLYELQRLIS